MAIKVACPFCKTANSFADDKRGRKVTLGKLRDDWTDEGGSGAD